MLESFTASLAASSKLSTGKIFMPDEPIMTLASSTLVPFPLWPLCTANANLALFSQILNFKLWSGVGQKWTV